MEHAPPRHVIAPFPHVYLSQPSDRLAAVLRRVPDEIWSAIFQSFVDEWEAAPFPFWKSSDARWCELSAYLHTIMGTCRLWRRIAEHHSPRLWANIRHGKLTSKTHFSSYYPAKSCIKRSGAVPLNLYASGPSYLRTMVTRLIAVGGIARVRSLTILECLSHFVQFSIGPSALFRNLGNLYRLSLESPDPLPWDCLFHMLTIFNRLRFLCIRRTSITFPEEHRSGSVILLELNTLQLLDMRRSRVLLFIFSNLTTPKLNRFAITVEDETCFQKMEWPSHVQALSSVQELTLGGKMGDIDVSIVLAQTPSVEILHLTSLKDDVVTILLGHLAKRKYAQKLNTITFHCCKVALEGLDRAIRSSQDSDSPVRAVGISVQTFFEYIDVSLPGYLRTLHSDLITFGWKPDIY